MILASTVPAPTADTLTQSTPEPLIEPEMVWSIRSLRTGSASPEIIDSLTCRIRQGVGGVWGDMGRSQHDLKMAPPSSP